LVLELQLLAAAFVQRQRRQGAALVGVRDATNLLLISNEVLHDHMLSLGQLSSPHLPPILLQQCGLQLLQALAAPVQQLLLEPDDDIGATLQTDEWQREQLYAFRAALSGCAMVQFDDPDISSTGEALTRAS
jgi:hypothetical protein